MRDFTYYTLDKDKNVVAIDGNDPEAIKVWEMDRRVAEDTVGDYWVSTVFLPMDHRFGGKGPPIVFETMVFDQKKRTPIGASGAISNGDDVWQERCCTWSEAVEMHNRVVQMVKDGKIPTAEGDTDAKRLQKDME